jgi:LPS-assembly protein
MATAGLEYSYPFISVHEWGHQIIEPVAQIIARPNEQDANAISNEDAQSLVFDDTLLFKHDKFSGFDRVEGGTRANLGVRYTMQTNDWGYGSVILGQSFQLAGANPFGPNTGLATSQSDWVGAVYLEPVDYFGLSSQFRLDNNTMSLRRHEFRGWTRLGPAYGSLTYAQDLAPNTPGVTTEREEIYGVGSLNVTNNWRLFGSARYDLSGSQWVQNGIGIGYFCDCMNVRIDYTEDFFRDRDDQPNRTISLQVSLKTLGGGSFDTDADTLTGLTTP